MSQVVFCLFLQKSGGLLKCTKRSGTLYYQFVTLVITGNEKETDIQLGQAAVTLTVLLAGGETLLPTSLMLAGEVG